jgi:hypothetical protein
MGKRDSSLLYRWGGPEPAPSLGPGWGKAGPPNLCPNSQAYQTGCSRATLDQVSSNLSFPNANQSKLALLSHTTSPTGAAGGNRAVGGLRPRPKCSCARRQALPGKGAIGKLRKKSHLKPTTKIFHKKLPPLRFCVK